MTLLRLNIQSAPKYLTVLMVFVLLFPVALGNAVLLLLFVSYVLSGYFIEKWQRIRSEPVAWSSLLLFGLFILGTLYSSIDFVDAVAYLNKYRELLLLPIMISIIDSETWKKWCYNAFLATACLAVTISYAMYFGWLPSGPPGQEWAPLTGRIAYSFILAYATYLMLHQAIQAGARKYKLMWCVMGGLAAFDLLYLVSGRTGHVIFACLILLLLFQYRHKIRPFSWLLLLLAIPAMGALVVATSPAIQSRAQDIQLAGTDLEASSIGQRLIFWQTSLHIIAHYPVLGAGVGSFAHEYARFNLEHPELYADNPHNEYLLIASQLGLIGLAAFIGLLAVQYWQSRRLPVMYKYAAQGLVVAMAIGCLFNSFLRDHIEGHFYAILAGVLFSGKLQGGPSTR